jgi:hypothetical protein
LAQTIAFLGFFTLALFLVSEAIFSQTNSMTILLKRFAAVLSGAAK